jgi:hypothetical protein
MAAFISSHSSTSSPTPDGSRVSAPGVMDVVPVLAVS